jgi:Protein of unknown function (DUF1838)
MNVTKLFCVAGLAGLAALSSLTSLTASAYDFNKPENSGEAFVRIRADTNGSDVFADWHTTVFIVEPGKRAVPVMRLDGFNVGRAIKKEDGSYQWLSREVAYYRDLKTGKILDKWENPVTGKTNDVLQVINDPVNGIYGRPGSSLPWRVKGDDVFLTVDVPLAYPNALLPGDFPEESTGPMYYATESFMFFAKQSDFDNPKLTSVPSTYSWARTGPWLPWMKMGQRPGYVLYTGQGKKLKGAAELDPVVREYTEKNYPDFMSAPKTLVTPNETSWTYYRKKFGKPTTGVAPPPAKEVEALKK